MRPVPPANQAVVDEFVGREVVGKERANTVPFEHGMEPDRSLLGDWPIEPVPPIPVNLEMGGPMGRPYSTATQRFKEALDVQKRGGVRVGTDIADEAVIPTSTVSAPAVAPAIRTGVAPSGSGLRLTATNFRPLAEAIKKQFGPEIEAWRTAQGSLPTAKDLQKLHPDELGNFDLGDLQKLVDNISPGERGKLPTGLHPETGKSLGRGTSDVDARMKGMTPEQEVEYYLRLGPKANGAIRDYLRWKLRDNPFMPPW